MLSFKAILSYVPFLIAIQDMDENVCKVHKVFFNVFTVHSGCCVFTYGTLNILCSQCAHIVISLVVGNCILMCFLFFLFYFFDEIVSIFKVMESIVITHCIKQTA